MKSRDWTQFILLSFAWGTSFLFIKLAVEEMSPLMVGWLRLLVAAATLWPIALLAGGRPRLRRQSLLALGVMAFFNNSLAFVLIPWGEQHISSGLAAIFNATVPLFTIILAHFFIFDERLSRPRLAGLIIGFAGVILVMAPEIEAGGDWLSAGSVQGSLAVIVASACYAVATVIGRRFLRSEQPMQAAAIQVTMGATWLLPLVLLTGGLGEVGAASPRAWGSLLWLGAVGTGLAYLFYFSLLRTVGATQVVVVTYVLPIIGVTLGVLILDETITWTMVAGLGLILAGVLAINGWPGARRVGE